MEVRPENLIQQRVAIIGLGLMGGSLALALRGKVAHLSGFDPDPQVCSQAIQRGFIQECLNHPIESISQADLVILAAPVSGILALLGEFSRRVAPPSFPKRSPGTILIDLGSTKSEIVTMMRALHEGFEPIGGHPMCGKERCGLIHADGNLFKGAPFVLVDLLNTTLRARNLALQLVQAVEACPIWLDAETHDRWVAFTSHLPYLLANTLANITPDEVARLVGPGFRSTARLAPSPRQMMLDILLTNDANILESLKRYRQNLEILETALTQADVVQLEEILNRGAAKYELLTKENVASTSTTI